MGPILKLATPSGMPMIVTQSMMRLIAAGNLIR
jgi:hypothetical protein